MSVIPFAKMEGLGNDYVYVEEFGNRLLNAVELAVPISDRHFGVGGDGLVLIGDAPGADFSMRIFNADGSEAEMCGNATRCVGKYLYDRGYTDKTELRLQTLAGVRTLSLELQGDKVGSVSVDMGMPVLEPEKIPLAAKGKDFINREVSIAGKIWHGTAVSMGNPHFVVFVDELDSLDLAAIGPAFENNALFPKRINTEFIQVLSRSEIRMRVWERGSGETLACGTGACASVVACVLNNLTDREVTVHLTGGDLSIQWLEDGTVRMKGTATHVFDGEYHSPVSLQFAKAGD